MKHLFLILMAWVLMYPAQAQVFNSEYPYTNIMDSILQNVNKSFMTTTILYDRILPVAGLHYFNTVLSNTSSRAHWEQAQFELYHSAYTKTGMTYPADLSLKMDVRIEEGKVPVGLLNYKFNWIDTNAVPSLLQYTNGLYYDVVGRPNHPFWQKEVTVVSLLADSIIGTSIVLDMDPIFRVANTGKTIQTLQADFGNGLGLVTLPSSGTYNVSFSSTGIKSIAFKITFTDLTIVNTNATIKVLPTTSSLVMADCDSLNQPIFATIPFKGYEVSDIPFRGKGLLNYYFATNRLCNGKVVKPIIVIDGYDPGDGRKGINIHAKYLSPASGYKFADTLRSKGYDIVILNFPIYSNELGKDIDGGVDHIERNGFVLVALIERLKAQLVANASNEKIVIIGPSMGGQISRYALRYMERASIDHKSRLWISFDSPHKGANIPIGLQYQVQKIPLAGAAKAKSKLGNPAAKQMLLHHYLANSLAPAGAPGYRSRWVDTLNLIGFPDTTKIRRIAVINGSLNGTANTLVGCGALIKANYFKVLKAVGFFAAIFWPPFAVLGLAEFKATSATAPNTGTCKVLDSHGWLVWGDKNASSLAGTSISIDRIPGGTFKSQDEVYSGLVSGWNILLTAGTTLINGAPHAFIPSKSALAYSGSNIDFAENIYTRNLVCTGETPFQTYYGPINTNQDHIFIDQPLARFCLDELDGIKRAPVFNTGIISVINGPSKFCGSGIYTVSNIPSNTAVTWSVSSGIATVTAGQGTNSVTVSRVSNGTFTLTATYNFNCISNMQTKSIDIGPYGSGDYPITGPSTACKNQTLNFTCPALTGVTSIAWGIPVGWTLLSGQNTTNLSVKTGTTVQTTVVTVQVNSICGAAGSPATKPVTVNNCTSAFKIFPNPAMDVLNVESIITEENPVKKKIKDILIVDQLGIQKIKIKLDKDTFEYIIDISILKAGPHIIQISDGVDTESIEFLKL